MKFVSISTIILFGLIISNQKTKLSHTWMFPIVPHPQEIYISDKNLYFTLNSETQFAIGDLSDLQDSCDISELKNFFQMNNLKSIKRVSEQQLIDSDNTIYIFKKLINNPELNKFPILKGFNFTCEYPGPEGYILHVTPHYILLVGHDDQGIYNAIQSLIQIVQKDKESRIYKIPVVTIVDYPDMSLRSAYYGFYLNAMEDDSLIERAYRDFRKISRFKFNMIDLASHHYGHLEMEVPGHPEEKLWQRYARLHQEARRFYLKPIVGGWAKWINTDSEWGADLTTLECIRTSQLVTMKGSNAYVLKLSSGQVAPNVMYNMDTGKSWQKEPVIVSNKNGTILYKEGIDYVINFGEIQSTDYQAYYHTAQKYLHVLFSDVHSGEGEPKGYPLRWGKTFNSPTTLQRLESGRIQDGQEVKISFSYIGPDPWSLIKVRYCRSDARLHKDGPQNYIWRWCTDPIRFWGASDFSIDVDETRVFAWDKRCQDSGKSRSQIWADDISYYYQTIRKSNPLARISIWSDMLDPAHNAIIYNTEEITSIFTEYNMTDIIMIPWKHTIAQESIEYFSNWNFPVMPSCMGETEDGISVAPKWAYWIRHYYSKKNHPYGLMHCHWGYGYNSGKIWDQLATVADHAWSVAPYILHKPVKSVVAGTPIKIIAHFEGDKFVFDGQMIRPGPLSLKNAILYYRTNWMSSFKQVIMTGSNDEYMAIIPDSEVKAGTIEYYISMSDRHNTTTCPKLGNKQPFKIKII